MTNRQLKIPDSHIDFIRLIKRSSDSGEGWRLVSNTLRSLAENKTGEQPELYETKVVGDSLMLRLSERGEIVSDYV